MEEEQIGDTMSEEEKGKAITLMNDYINSCNCEDLQQVHWKLRVVYTVTCSLLDAIEQGHTHEHKLN